MSSTRADTQQLAIPPVLAAEADQRPRLESPRAGSLVRTIGRRVLVMFDHAGDLAVGRLAAIKVALRRRRVHNPVRLSSPTGDQVQESVTLIREEDPGFDTDAFLERIDEHISSD